MLQNLTCYHLLIVAALVATAAPAEAEDANCSPLQLQRHGMCYGCPLGGLVRPFDHSCYDRIEVRRAHRLIRSSEGDRLEPISESNPVLFRSIDKKRYQKSLASSATVGHKLWFTVGFLDATKHVERFLVWKPKQQLNGSDCVFNASRYLFHSSPDLKGITRRHSSLLGPCQQSDQGRYVILTCDYQRILGLEMAMDDGQELTECDVPAEVEAYGTDVKPQIGLNN